MNMQSSWLRSNRKASLRWLVVDGPLDAPVKNIDESGPTSRLYEK